jgi:hypothetical protein
MKITIIELSTENSSNYCQVNSYPSITSGDVQHLLDELNSLEFPSHLTPMRCTDSKVNQNNKESNGK